MNDSYFNLERWFLESKRYVSEIGNFISSFGNSVKYLLKPGLAVSAGAASVHIHGRGPENRETNCRSGSIPGIVAGIKARSNVIVCVTTGGTAYKTPEGRGQSRPALKAKLATLNMGTINFSMRKGLT